MKRLWMLPEDIIDHLPPETARIEQLRRTFLDNAKTWGYRLVMPPLVEFLDSLLAVGSEVLDVQTFKITDRKTGKLMGIRADMTPQIARIDAHRLPTDEISRFSYCGEVLRSQSESNQARRNPLIAGAELYGISSISADIEIISLLLDSLQIVNLKNSVINLGHSGIFAGLVQLHNLNEEQRNELRDVLIGLRRPDLHAWLQNRTFSSACIEDIRFLVDIPLALDPLDAIEKQFSGRHQLFDRALGDLLITKEQLQNYFPNQKVAIDISVIGTYGYHSGLIFDIYAEGHYDTIARGGRYDGLGEVYGKSRAACGFSIDLLTLAEILVDGEDTSSIKISDLPKTQAEFVNIQQCRRNGDIIIFNHN